MLRRIRRHRDSQVRHNQRMKLTPHTRCGWHQLGRSRSDLIRDALRRQLALVRFEQARRGLLPMAEAKGVLTDEDVFALVS